MEALINQVPYGGVVAGIVIVILGIAAGMYMLDSYRSKKKKEEDGDEDRLIGILQTTVKELEGKVDKLVAREKELTKEVSDLSKENKTLLAVLQGRDQQTQEFYKQGFESMKRSEQMFETMKTLVESVATLSKSIEKNNEMTADFVKTIKEHFLTIEKAALTGVVNKQ